MLIKPPSVVLAQLFSVLCRFLPCEDRYENPTSLLPEGFRASRTLGRNLKNGVQDEEFSSRYSRTALNNSEVDSQLLLKIQNDETQDDLLPPIASTKSGDVEGYYMKVVSGRKIYAFEGIPYAEKPTLQNRFKVSLQKNHQKLYYAK